MTNFKHEKQKLLNDNKNIGILENGTVNINDDNETSSSSSIENNDETEGLIESNGVGAGAGAGGDGDESKCKRKRLRLSATTTNRRRRRQHHNTQRGARRIARLMFCVLLVPMFFLMLYIPLYTDVQGRQVALPDWDFNTSRNLADYVLPENDTTILEPRNVCRNKTFVLIVVCSSFDNFVARQTIRESWGNITEFNYGIFTQLHQHLQGQYLNPTKERLKFYSEFINLKDNETSLSSNAKTVLPVRIVFLIGRSKYETFLGNESIARLRRESEQYDDIIQENFIDTYNNLTLKSVLALKWATRRCLQQCAFFMKCDDDTFINIPNLIHFLLGGTVPLYNDTFGFYDVRTYQTLAKTNRMTDTHNYLAGHLFCTSRPVANVSSKWYMPYYMFPADKYPKYLSGSGYLMSMDVVPRLYEAALNTTFIYLEDVYITGMCAEKAKLKRRHHPLFGYTRSKQFCSFKGIITQHEMKDDSMLEAYAFVVNVSNRCPPPGKYFKHMRLHKHNSCI